MKEAKEQILKLVSQYIIEKHAKKTWTPGKDWVQYSGPYYDHNEYINAISTLLEEWLVLGQDAQKFEKQFASILGKSHGIVTNSGSSSNLLMIATIIANKRHAENFKIILPVAGFPTTVNPALQLGLKPTFVDIELETLNLNLDQVEMEASTNTHLMFAHVLGNPPNMDRVMEIVNKYHLTLLEDCCDAVGSKYNNIPLGFFGRMATASFYPAHHITMGEGGFVACNQQDEKIIRSLRDWGRGCYCVGKKANLSTKGTCGCRFKAWLPSLPNEIFDHKYVYENIGYNLKPIELQCSMGLAQLDKLPLIRIKRNSNHARLTEIFKPYEEFFHIHRATPKASPSWFAFPITVRDEAPFKRSQFTRYMEENKIQTRNYFGGNILLQPAYRYLDTFNNAHTRYPVATKVTTDTLFLGTSPIITPEQLDYVQETINKFFTKRLWQFFA